MSKPKKKNTSNPPPSKERSFTVALEQMAHLLRSEVKLKDRATKAPSVSSLDVAIKQIAKLLRHQIRSIDPAKIRAWKKKAGPQEI